MAGPFDTSDRPIDLIFDAARRLIGDDLPPIERRWSGVSNSLADPGSDEIYYRRAVASGVELVTGAGGRGMTLAPVIAEETFG